VLHRGAWSTGRVVGRFASRLLADVKSTEVFGIMSIQTVMEDSCRSTYGVLDFSMQLEVLMVVKRGSDASGGWRLPLHALA
jgi:hypothetical protein